jgi:hypothetical protein
VEKNNIGECFMPIGSRGEDDIDSIFDNIPRCPHCGSYEDFDPCGYFSEDKCHNLDQSNDSGDIEKNKPG